MDFDPSYLAYLREVFAVPEPVQMMLNGSEAAAVAMADGGSMAWTSRANMATRAANAHLSPRDRRAMCMARPCIWTA